MNRWVRRTPWKLWAVTAAGVIAVGLVALRSITADPTRWGAAGQWAGAAGSVAAVVVALWIAHRDWERAVDEREDRDRAQARLVRGEVSGRNDPRIVIRNHSNVPIFQAQATWVEGPEHRGLAPYPERETPSPPAVVEGASSHAIKPVHLLDRQGRAWVNYPVQERDYTVTVRFLDASGLWWKRTGLDEPVRTDSEGRRLL